MNILHRQNRGFIALFSALIISALLILLVIVSSSQSFFSRFDEFDAEARSSAQSVALGCGSMALNIIAHDHAYQPRSEGDVTSDGQISCTITSVIWSSDAKDLGYSIATIDTFASVRSAFAKAETVARIQDPTLPRSIPLEPEVIVISSREFEK